MNVKIWKRDKIINFVKLKKMQIDQIEKLCVNNDYFRIRMTWNMNYSDEDLFWIKSERIGKYKNQITIFPFSPIKGNKWTYIIE